MKVKLEEDGLEGPVMDDSASWKGVWQMNDPGVDAAWRKMSIGGAHESDLSPSSGTSGKYGMD